MFERTVTIFRQLVGQPEQANYGKSAAAQEERRNWKRFPADFETTCRPAGANPAESLKAKVRNISLGGISLLVERPFAEGDLINIELPAAQPDTQSTVLACIIFVQRKGDQGWILGCTFSRELTDDDLQPFGARRVRHEPADQRTFKRFGCDLDARYHSVGARSTDQATAQVLNLSATGVGLLLPQHLENGTLLNLELQGAQGVKKSLLACIVHVARHEAGLWAVGCNFIRTLSEADLKTLQ